MKVALVFLCGLVDSGLGLEADSVWKHFKRILTIPRCSGNEKQMQEYVEEVAARAGLQSMRDHARNVIVKRPGSNGGEGAPPIIIQAHLDMVCENNADTKHDWTKDAIVTTERDGWMVADHTTLGADNGIGVALSLALLEQPTTVVSPPLEAVFTVEEETGLNGARDLDISLLSGRHLLNFDSEEWGIIYIGCAGGGDAQVRLPVQAAPLDPSARPFQVSLQSLRGGHSGADIHEGRGNAVRLLGRALAELIDIMPGLRLLHIEGGNKDNAIPRESKSVVGFNPTDFSAVRDALAAIETDLKKEYSRIEPDMMLSLAAQPFPASQLPASHYLSQDSASRLLDLVRLMPYGPLKMSHEVPGLVETSNNVAAVKRVDDATFEVLCLARSSIGSAMEHTHRTIARAATRCGAEVVRGTTFPGWAPNLDQDLLLKTEGVLELITGTRPNVTAIHAGLECGIIGDKIPGIEMVSFGPDILGAHAPGERVRIESVDNLVVLVRELLRQLASEAPKQEL